MNIESITPLRGWVLVEAAHEPEQKSGLYLPLEYRERFPQVGWVRAAGAGSNLKKDQLVVVPNEGFEVGQGYWEVCYIVLFDEGRHTKIQCDLEVWPVVRENVEDYRRTREQRFIRVKTTDGETLGFTADEVLDYGIEDLSNPGYKVDYVPATHLWEWEDGICKLFYFVREDDILLTIER